MYFRNQLVSKIVILHMTVYRTSNLSDCESCYAKKMIFFLIFLINTGLLIRKRRSKQKDMADHDGLPYDIKLDVPEHIDIHEITRDIKPQNDFTKYEYVVQSMKNFTLPQIYEAYTPYERELEHFSKWVSRWNDTRKISPPFTSDAVYGYIHDNRDPDDMGDYNDWIKWWKYFVLFPKTRSLVKEVDWFNPEIMYEMYIGTIHNGSLLWLFDRTSEIQLMSYLKQKIFVVAGESHEQHG